MTNRGLAEGAPGSAPLAGKVWVNTLSAVVLLATAIGICFAHGPAGTIFGLIAALAFALYVWIHRTGLADLRGLVLLVLAGVALIGMIVDPGPLNTSLVWLFLACTALRVHGDAFHDLGGLLLRALRLGASGIPATIQDLIRFRRSGTARSVAARFRLDQALLPLLATAILSALLLAANPIISAYANLLSFQWLADVFLSFGAFVAVAAFLLLWPLLRGGAAAMTMAIPPVGKPAPPWHARYFAPLPVLVTLLMLNALLGIQNVLDLAFIWSGKALPNGITFAEYAHRGAYPLIVTALLAGAFVIVALWPGARTGESRAIRQLVYLWIAQNVLLVASTIDRTLAYVDAYGTTELRLAALIWMALVAWGLGLVAVRIAGGRDNQWLINANMISAAVLLLASSLFDHATYVANYNVEAALSQEGGMAQLDHDYLRDLGISALPALRKLEARLSAQQSGIIASDAWSIHDVRMQAEFARRLNQADWRRWTLRRYWMGDLVALPPPNR